MARTKKGEPLKVPLGEDGSLMHYYHSWRDAEDGPDPVLKDNFEFEDTLVLVGMSRGRSAAYFNFESASVPGRTFPMFMSEMERLLNNRAVIRGRVTARWTFCKRGSNYSVRLAETQLQPSDDDLAIATAAVFGDKAAAMAIADKVRED